VTNIDIMNNIEEKESGEYKIVLRHLNKDDYDGIIESMNQAYSAIDIDVWKRKEINNLLKVFPEGQLCIELNGKVVGCALSLIVDYDKYGDNHTYEQITGNDTFKTHNPKGDILYGIDVFVHPEYHGMRLGRRLYDARKDLCENLNLKGIIAGGRIPGYSKYAEEMTPKQYIDKVKLKEIYDPILSFQMANDFHVKKILRNYLPYDKESKTYATLIEWNNIYYEEKEELLSASSVVRIGVAQWQMRNTPSLAVLLDQVEFFVDAVSAYQADFVLFPEFFNAPLMAQFNHLSEADAIRGLADFTEPLREKFIDLAISYNINIISGSMPMYEDEKLYNVAFLCRRDGTWDIQYKIHPTPDEVATFGMQGGNEIKVFDTDAGRIGILICYDVEFPELPRVLAEEGMDILFVPFLTDTQNGYNRVRICSQSRAIENECYVVIAGSVGNLPKVKNMGIQYAQSAVFSPSDFAFPNNAIVAETTPNTEMTLLADVDLSLLKELHNQGSVRNLKDRRTDLFKLSWRKKK
jgi:predicted amidohydrolase/ribosomal protein S18 acetylase RimI-like enzyme